jgi:hypothetical protein
MLSFKYITEALKAEDYEASIVMGFYELTGRPISDPSKHGISPKIFDSINKSPVAKEAGLNIARYVLNKYPALKNKNAEQYGRARTSITPYWKSHGASNVTPKTDVLIGDMRFSVKIGLAQLMSGGKAESTATFEAAVKNSSKELKKSSQYDKVVDVLEGFVKNTLAPTQLRPLIKSGTNEVVNKAERAHKDAMKELGALFEESKSFKIEFAKEAMSGFEKFGKDSLAASEFMLVANSDGSKVSIHSVYDENYCLKIANSMRLQARFKTSSRKLKGVKTGEYNFWSVISLIVDSMQDSEELQEAKLVNVIRNWMNKTWRNVTSYFKKGISQLKTFLGLEVDVRVKDKVKF